MEQEEVLLVNLTTRLSKGELVKLFMGQDDLAPWRGTR